MAFNSGRDCAAKQARVPGTPIQFLPRVHDEVQEISAGFELQWGKTTVMRLGQDLERM